MYDFMWSQGVNSIDYSNLSFCFTLYLFVLLCPKTFKQTIINSRLGSLVARQKDLFFTTSAFTTFSPADLTPIFNGDDAKSDILEDTHLQQIFANLPPKIQNQPWTLAYSTQVNGFSLKNLYRECKSSNTDDPSAAFRNQGRNHTGV